VDFHGLFLDVIFMQLGERAFRNAPICGGEVTLWVMNRRAGHWLP
jgi:hypothetical protein